MSTSKAQRLATAERRTRCIAMRREGHEWQDIADALGYAGAAAACKDYNRAMEQRRDQLDAQQTLMRAETTEQLLAARREVWKVLRREHVTVSHGRVVQKWVGWELDEDGEPLRNADGERIPIMEDLLDDGPVLSAVDRLVKIEDQLAKLWGYAAPTKVEHTGQVRYEVEGVALDALE